MLENLPYFTHLKGYISGSVANLSLIKGSWRAKEGLHSWGARLVLKWRKESKKIEKNQKSLAWVWWSLQACRRGVSFILHFQTASQCHTMDLTQDVVKALMVHVLGFKAVGCLSVCLVSCIFFACKKETSEMCIIINIKQSVCGKSNIRSLRSSSHRDVLATNSHMLSRSTRLWLPRAWLFCSLYVHRNCCCGQSCY